MNWLMGWSYLKYYICVVKSNNWDPPSDIKDSKEGEDYVLKNQWIKDGLWPTGPFVGS